MKTSFIPIDYDYFDFEGKNHALVIGRDNNDKKICVIDTCDVYLWAILKKNISISKINKIIEKTKKIQINKAGRTTKIQKIELQNKKFLEKDVKALKIYADNYKDLHAIADHLGQKEIQKRRGYDLGYVTHYIIEKKLEPLNWYEIKGQMLNNSNEFGGIDNSLNADFVIKLESFKELKEKKFTPRTMAYDIETDELQIGKGEILMISLVSKNFQKVITWKKSLTKTNKKYVEFVEDEKELLQKFCEHIKQQSPDFLIGYYSDGFDMPYIKARADKFKIRLPLGIDNSQPRFSSGINTSAKIKGIVHVDILKFIRTTYAQYMKSETLSLNEVSKEFLNDTKKPFTIEHSSKLDKNKWEKYYEYNLHDSVLTLQLFEKFWPDMQEFSKIIKEPIYDISRNGLSKQIESYMLHHLEQFNEIPERRPTHSEIGERRSRRSVQGAFVYEPKPGLYNDLAMFDFTSMHTSIIISYNLSKATLLEKSQKQSYKSPDIEIDNKKTNFYFLKEPGFFPTLLKEIFKKRKQYKAEYQKAPSTITKARSNAFKLLSASAHGYVGFFGARYYSWETSSTILAFVRKFNIETIEKIKQAGHEVIYGDSVSGNSKIWIKEKGDIKEIDIENLFEKTDSKDLVKKEYNFKQNIEILTINEKGESVFKPIKYVMRHKTNKKMYRIHFTNQWNIDVTEDHSLIGYQSSKFNQSKKNKKDILNRLIEIKPEEIKKKASTIISLEKIPQKKEDSKNYFKEIYEFLGLFIGDGSFAQNKLQSKLKKDYYLSLSLGLDKKELIDKLIIPLQKKGYIKNFWESKTRKGDIKINGQKLIDIVKTHCKKDNKKDFPKFILKEKKENISSFLRGYFTADGTVMLRNNAPIIKLTSINQEFLKNSQNLLYFLGISNSIFKENTLNTYKTKKKIYGNKTYSKNLIIKNKEEFMKEIGFLLNRKNKRGNIKTKATQKKLIKNFEFDTQKVIKIEEIKTPKYVYDVEVDKIHRFFANNCLVHNTDSVAFTTNKKSKKQILELLNKLNKDLPGVMHLELEGFFKRGLWVTTRKGTTGAKKKYAMVDEKDQIKIRGFETVRRDWCTLARNVQDKIIRLILKEGNEKKALEFLKKIIKQLKERKIDKQDLMIKTQLKKPLSEYKAISPHVIAARKMIEQNIPIDQGNIIKYFIAETKGKTKLVRDKVKLPEEKGEYNKEYYLKKQILPAVENIFQVFNINIVEVIEGKKQMTLGDF